MLPLHMIAPRSNARGDLVQCSAPDVWTPFAAGRSTRRQMQKLLEEHIFPRVPHGSDMCSGSVPPRAANVGTEKLAPVQVD